MAVKFTVEENPDPASRDAILVPLVQFNIAKAGPTRISNFAIFLRNSESEAIVGGLWGRFAANWLFVELLFVPEDMRGGGVGRSLMQQAETAARASGCTGVWLDSFSFQAPRFYEKLGYAQFGKLEKYPGHHTRHFFSKRLDG